MPGPFLVAIIDDDDAVRDSVALLLGIHGFIVQGFVSAEEYLFAEPEGIQAVLADQNLPGITGLDLLRRLIEGGHPPLLGLISARMDGRMRAQAEELGAAAFEKPAPTDGLLAWLGGPRT